MRRSLHLVVLIVACFMGSAVAQNDVVLEKKSNYNSWGTAWDSVYVLKNGISTIAIVPKLGGRIMQYDLGTHPSIYVHESAKGKLPTSGDSMIGGCRQLPSPQADFGWPSPPKVDFGNYTCTVVKNSPDSVVLDLESPTEDSNLDKYKTHKGIQFGRIVTMYKASSRVKVEMVMRNKGTQPMTHGVWDITQSACSNNNAADVKNFWVYFKRSSPSKMNTNGFVQYNNEGTDATQWKPNAVPGNIMAVQYLQKVGKIGADCSAGWISFTDQLDGYAYIKTFTYENGKTYPDSGASVQVYTYKDYNMIEVEVLGPLTALAVGDSVKLVENWFAARSLGPVIDVTAAGLVTSKLTLSATADSLSVKGVFGVFYPGVVRYIFYDAANTPVGAPDSVQVSPTDSLVVNKKLKALAGAKTLRLMLFDKTGKSCGMLDSVSLPAVGIKTGRMVTDAKSVGIAITALRGELSIDLSQNGRFVVDLLTVDGKRMYRGVMDGAGHFNIPCRRSSGIHLITVTGMGTAFTQPVYLMQTR